MARTVAINLLDRAEPNIQARMERLDEIRAFLDWSEQEETIFIQYFILLKGRREIRRKLKISNTQFHILKNSCLQKALSAQRQAHAITISTTTTEKAGSGGQE